MFHSFCTLLDTPWKFLIFSVFVIFIHRELEVNFWSIFTSYVTVVYYYCHKGYQVLDLCCHLLLFYGSMEKYHNRRYITLKISIIQYLVALVMLLQQFLTWLSYQCYWWYWIKRYEHKHTCNFGMCMPHCRHHSHIYRPD